MISFRRWLALYIFGIVRLWCHKTYSTALTQSECSMQISRGCHYSIHGIYSYRMCTRQEVILSGFPRKADKRSLWCHKNHSRLCKLEENGALLAVRNCTTKLSVFFSRAEVNVCENDNAQGIQVVHNLHIMHIHWSGSVQVQRCRNIPSFFLVHLKQG